GRLPLRHPRRVRLDGHRAGPVGGLAPETRRHRAPHRRPRVTRAILFDLDDTLVVEEPAAVAAFSATAASAAARVDVAPARLAPDARAGARELWCAAPTHPVGRRVGCRRWEGVWRRYEVGGEDLRALRAWAPEYRREAWRIALADQGVDDAELGAALGARF